VTAQRIALADLVSGDALSQALTRRHRQQEAQQMRRVLLDDVYNPLLGILGNLELLGAADLAPEVRVCHEEIKDCAQRINFAIRELAKLSPTN